MVGDGFGHACAAADELAIEVHLEVAADTRDGQRQQVAARDLGHGLEAHAVPLRTGEAGRRACPLVGQGHLFERCVAREGWPAVRGRDRAADVQRLRRSGQGDEDQPQGQGRDHGVRHEAADSARRASGPRTATMQGRAQLPTHVIRRHTFDAPDNRLAHLCGRWTPTCAASRPRWGCVGTARGEFSHRRPARAVDSAGAAAGRAVREGARTHRRAAPPVGTGEGDRRRRPGTWGRIGVGGCARRPRRAAHTTRRPEWSHPEPDAVPAPDAGARHHLRHRPGRHRQDLPGRGLRRGRAGTSRRAAHRAHAPGGRGRGTARLPARRPGAEGRPLPASLVRRALRPDGFRPRGQGLRKGSDRNRAAGLHARAHAEPCLRDPRRGPEHDPRADEDVPDPHRVRQPVRGQRRREPDRPAAGHRQRPGRGGAGAGARAGHRLHALHRRRRRAPPAGGAHRRGLRSARPHAPCGRCPRGGAIRAGRPGS